MPSVYNTNTHTHDYTCDFCGAKLVPQGDNAWVNERYYGGASLFTCEHCDKILRLLGECQATYRLHNEATEKLRVATGN